MYSDTGFVTIDKQTLEPQCYYPSVDALDALFENYPTLTIVHVVRETESWYASMAKWGDGSLLKRWRRCNATGFPGWTLKPQKIKKFYDWHTDNIRQFATKHPSLNYIEVSLESSETGRIHEDRIGIPAKCWGKCSPNSKFCNSAYSS